jgi:hypothetical protein
MTTKEDEIVPATFESALQIGHPIGKTTSDLSHTMILLGQSGWAPGYLPR